MTRFAPNTSVINHNNTEERLRRVEQNFQDLQNRLFSSYVLGRLRIDRTAPANSSDVSPPDKLYDIVRDEDYEYILINDSGTLAWRRITMSSF